MRHLAFLLVAAGLACSCSSHCVQSKVRPQEMKGFAAEPWEPVIHGGRSMQVFKIVDQGGPPVIILHEVTGLSPETFRLGRLIASAGFTVYLPLLFGKPGDARFVVNTLRACTGGQFHCFDREQSNDPHLVEALLVLSRRASAEHGNAPVGVIGMCLTGNTGLELVETCSPVRAVVASQPALPFAGSNALGVSAEVIERVKKLDVPVLALRFTEDGRSPVQRMDRLQQELLGQLTRHEIDSSPLNSFRIRKMAHGVLTGDFSDEPGHPTREALDEVILLLRRTLGASPVTLECPAEIGK